MSKKPIARKFQKWVANTIKELRKNGEYKLQNELETEKKLNESKLEQQKHLVLLEKMNHKRTLYLTRVYVFPDGTFVIKLGYSDGIQHRNRAHRTHFGSSLLLDVFECDKNREFELFLKRHPNIMCYAFKDPINNVTSLETYKVNLDEYNKIIDLIKKNIDDYQGFNHDQYIEIEKLKLQNRICNLLEDNKINNEDAIKLFSTNTKENEQDLEDDSDSDESISNNSIQTSSNSVQSRTNTKYRKIQQYDPNNFELIKTFDGLMDVIRTHPNFSQFGIKNSASKNTIYNGFRWFYIAPDAEHIKYEIPETVTTQPTSIPQLIAVLNKDKTRIENVCASQSQAASELNINRKQTINTCIKKESLYKNTYYFKYFDDCEESLQNEYLAHNTLPVTTKIGLKINKIDVTNNEIITTYDSISDVLKNNCISRAHVKKACENNEIHNGYYWKYAVDE